MCTKMARPPHDHHRVSGGGGGVGGAKRIAVGSHAYMNRPADKRARNNKKKGIISKSAGGRIGQKTGRDYRGESEG